MAANGLNKQLLIGNLGQDPEVKYTQGGTAVCNLRVAVNERVKKGDSWEDHTEWFTVVTFGKTAENVGQYLGKGRQVYVEGKNRERKWQDQSGNDRWSREIVADRVIFMQGGQGQGQGQGGNRPGGNRQGGGGQPSSGNGDGFYDDDLPF